MSTIEDTNKPIFNDLTAENPVTEVDSVCMNCYKTVIYLTRKWICLILMFWFSSKGVTRLILTRIPFYKDVIISSFTCDECGYRNNGVESANKIQDKGITIDLLINSQQDLNREIIKSDFANLKIPEIDFEIPEMTQKACE